MQCCRSCISHFSHDDRTRPSRARSLKSTIRRPSPLLIRIALEQRRRLRFGDITVFTPTPRHEFEHVMKPAEQGADRDARVRLGGRDVRLLDRGVDLGLLAIVVGGKAIATWVPFTIEGFELMVLIGGLATVFAMFAMSHVPRLTTTVGLRRTVQRRPLRRLGRHRPRSRGRRDGNSQEARSRGGAT